MDASSSASSSSPRPARTPAVCASPSPLAVLEAAFTALATGPRPLTIPARLLTPEIPRVPGRRAVPLAEVRSALRRAGSSSALGQRVWSHVIARAQGRHGRAWVIAAAGLAAPSLRALLRRRGAAELVDRQDLEQELLATFLEQLRAADPLRAGEFARMRRAVDRAVHRLLARARADAELRCPLGPELAETVVEPGRPQDGEAVLRRAVAHGVITPAEAELIAAKRIDNTPARVLACGDPARARMLQRRRHAAEYRLAEAIRAGRL